MMAGAWPILPTPDDLRLLRVLSNHHLAQVLEELDESGWTAAEQRLRAFAKLPEYQEQQPPTDDAKGETP